MRTGPQRLRVRAHAPTARASALVFSDDGPTTGLHPAEVSSPARATDGSTALCGPEPACGQTAEAHGWAAQVSTQLRGPDTGSWTGLGLAEVADRDPEGLAHWLADPDARPHGGETLTELVARAGELLATGDASGQPRLWVATPLVVRAVVVAALGAPPRVLFAVDVGFDGEVRLSGSGRTWRLQGLRRAGRGDGS